MSIVCLSQLFLLSLRIHLSPQLELSQLWRPEPAGRRRFLLSNLNQRLPPQILPIAESLLLEQLFASSFISPVALINRIINGFRKYIESSVQINRYTIDMNTNKVALLLKISFIGAIASALFLRLQNLTRSPFWLDENFTAALIKFNPFEIILRTGLDVHPPLYYLVLKVWAALFGHTDLALRSFSVLFGILTILVVYRLIIEATKSNLTAHLFLWAGASAPFLIQHSQDARMYTFGGFLFALSSLYFWRLFSSAGSKRDKQMYVFVSTAALFTHVFLAAFILAQVLFLVLESRGLPKKWRKLIKKVALYYSPWVPVIIVRSLLIERYGFWIPALSFERLTSTLPAILTAQPSINDTLLIISVFLLIFLSLWHVFANVSKTEAKIAKFLTVSWLGGTIILIIASIPPLQPVFIYRYLIFGLPFLLAAAAYGLSLAVKDRVDLIKMAASTGFLIAIGIIAYRGIPFAYSANVDEPTYSSVQEVLSRHTPNDAVVVYDDPTYFMAIHYLPNYVDIYIISDSSTVRNSPILNFRDDIFIDKLEQIKNKTQIWTINGGDAQLVNNSIEILE
jgi:hypothetical protein